MSSPVISLSGVSKSFTIYETPRELLKEIVLGGTRHDVFWALKDVSLEVPEGARFAIIGPNGAGKSTLLKLIAGTLTPTSGAIHVEGRVSAMLSLTSFLDPEETGLENIRFNLLANGADRAAIPEMTEDIVDFTELGAFIHAPVRTYSAGMNARLAFAISTAVAPDILIVDEVLGAGDAYFASKATLRMIDLSRRGRALLFVSHSMDAVQLLCDTAIWLDGGVIREIGPVAEIARRYEADFRRQEDEVLRTGNIARRDRLATKLLPVDVARPGVSRIRLTGPAGRIADTHYVRRVGLDVDGRAIDVGLDFSDLGHEEMAACLDVAQSEWGRPHERRGNASRVLAAGSSLLRGGHILLRPGTNGSIPLPLTLTIESASLSGTEDLHAQVMDVEAGEWSDLKPIERLPLDDGWFRSTFRGALAPPRDIQPEELEHLLREARPDVEIVDVTLLVNQESVLSVKERQPFTLAVRVRANRTVAKVDAIIKLVRSDGLYVFWQSSGQVGVFAEELTGVTTFAFDFDPNMFGAGDYEVTVDLGNGFDIETNFPHSEIYDRRVGALTFTVAREWPLLMSGPVNHRFPVRIEEPSE